MCWLLLRCCADHHRCARRCRKLPTFHYAPVRADATKSYGQVCPDADPYENGTWIRDNCEYSCAPIKAGHVCPQPSPNESGACVNGRCTYACVDGAVRCNRTCTFLYSDPHNCGACGKVCPPFAPYCNQGACSACPPPLVRWGIRASISPMTPSTAEPAASLAEVQLLTAPKAPAPTAEGMGSPYAAGSASTS
jgi:hypothetical protein